MVILFHCLRRLFAVINKRRRRNNANSLWLCKWLVLFLIALSYVFYRILSAPSNEKHVSKDLAKELRALSDPILFDLMIEKRVRGRKGDRGSDGEKDEEAEVEGFPHIQAICARTTPIDANFQICQPQFYEHRDRQQRNIFLISGGSHNSSSLTEKFMENLRLQTAFHFNIHSVGGVTEADIVEGRLKAFVDSHQRYHDLENHHPELVAYDLGELTEKGVLSMTTTLEACQLLVAFPATTNNNFERMKRFLRKMNQALYFMAVSVDEAIQRLQEQREKSSFWFSRNWWKGINQKKGGDGKKPVLTAINRKKPHHFTFLRRSCLPKYRALGLEIGFWPKHENDK